jgi:four helix bundle protein
MMTSRGIPSPMVGYFNGVDEMRAFRDLAVWRKAHGVTLETYRSTQSFPKSELYGLTSQIRRAAASVCANIAEGCGRRGKADFARFLQISLGSASELEYHLLLAADLEFLDSVAYKPLADRVVEVKRMLTGLIRKLMADG